MMLHFAYGSNMSRTLMRQRCPGATELGPARLEGHRFIITRAGYASVEPAPGQAVHGVLWRLTPRDFSALNTYESLGSGLYVRRILPVRRGARCERALIYVAPERRRGRPQPGYHDIIVASARARGLPEAYVQSLERWAPGGFAGTRAAATGEVG
jgi:AIG2-like family